MASAASMSLKFCQECFVDFVEVPYMCDLRKALGVEEVSKVVETIVKGIIVVN